LPDRVRIVLVSHSAQLARGVAELAAQMAPDVDLVAAGGSDDGGLGTSFDLISAALAGPPAAGVVVLYDLGSALLTTETALEFMDPDDAARVEVVDAPLVEGALAAATTAHAGADRAAVAAAAAAAGGAPAEQGVAAAPPADALHREVVLPNPLGLHARPAAEVARALSGLAARVRVGRPDGPAADLRSVLDVVKLALRGGQTVLVSASGADAERALAAVIGLIEGGFGEADGGPALGQRTPQPATDSAAGPRPGAPGRAIGPLVHAGAVSVPDAPAAGPPDRERERLTAAVNRAREVLQRGDALAQMHAALVGDPAVRTAADERIARGASAESAWWAAVSESAASLAGSADEVVAARAVDLQDAGAAVLTELGVAADRIPAEVDGAVLAAAEIGPGELGEFAARGGTAVVLAAGSPTAHAVVVARGLGVPLVLRAGDLLDGVTDGTLVAVDGAAGTVEVDPPDAAAWRARITAEAAARAAQQARAAEPVTVRGRRIVVAANVGSLAEARAAVANGADAVGLLRTELLLLDGEQLPDEDRQAADLAAIFDVLGEREVVVRVLDAGGDKPVRALRLDPRRNGFLGVRGLRWLLANPDVLHTQLRAICRAASGHRVAVMAPMVALAGEARTFRESVAAAVETLNADGIEHAVPDRVGVMIEIPAAALTVDEIAEHADFVSIGTNDLVSYTMAADRTEPGVADLLDARATAVWRLLESLCERARGRVEVAVCGEMAADPQFAARFVELGVTELSMAPAAIPVVKEALRAL
jgi:multiphosphoryl transfer protein